MTGEKTRHKMKLSVEEQIADMKLKGISFEILTEEDATKFLKFHTYYFKLKAYARNYDKYRSTEKIGQYIGLDFAYLKEISSIDMHFRKLIIDLSLDVEHALKVKLLYDLSRNSKEDGYNIVKIYFDTDSCGGRLARVNDKAGKSFISDLVTNHKDNDIDYALWEIVEILSFGDFIDLYDIYYQYYPSENEDYRSFLWSIKFLRNAAAHNNCLLNSIKAPYSRKLERTKRLMEAVSKTKTDSTTREKWMKNPVIHDFLALVYVYVQSVKSDTIKQRGVNEIKELFDKRMTRHADYFEKNNTLTGAYAFVKKVVYYFCNKFR